MSELQSEDLKLRVADLDAALKTAVQHAEALQRRGAIFDARERHRALALPNGDWFLPDERDADTPVASVFGGLAALMGLALAGVAFEARHPETWMVIAAPILLTSGGWLFWRAQLRAKQLAREPRKTGAYLVGNTLLYVNEFGCRVFPADRIAEFEWESRTAGERTDWNLVVRFVDDEGRAQQVKLGDRNLEPSLTAWLATRQGD